MARQIDRRACMGPIVRGRQTAIQNPAQNRPERRKVVGAEHQIGAMTQLLRAASVRGHQRDMAGVHLDRDLGQVVLPDQGHHAQRDIVQQIGQVVVAVAIDMAQLGQPGAQGLHRGHRVGLALRGGHGQAQAAGHLGGQRGQRSRFFALLPYNVLTREEVVDIWCEFHGLDRAYFELHGRDSDDVYHPFRELYDCGLLGIIAREPGSERQLQRFRQPHDAAVGFRRRLPRSRYYLLHPALQALVRRLSGGLQFHAFRQLVVGHGEPWARHAGPTLDVQRELFRGAARDDLETEHEVLTALARLDRLVAMGEPFDHARRQIAASAALVRLTARLERVGWDELYVALLELFPASDDHPARARD